MATKENKEILSGLENADNVKEAEYDLVASLLEAANYRESEDLLTTVDISRAGKFLFAVSVHPIGDEEIKAARKQAKVMMNNPQNRKLPKVQKDFDDGKFNSLIIYSATCTEDQKKIWGNDAIKKKYDLVENYESVDVLLTAGEKADLVNLIIEISGMNDDEDEVSKEEYTKN